MARVTLQGARSAKTEADETAEDLLAQLGTDLGKFVVLYASRDRDHTALNQAVRKRLPSGVRLLGASTGGEIDNRGYHSGQAMMASLSGDFEVGIGIGTNLSKDAVGAGTRAIDAAFSPFGAHPDELSSSKYVAIAIDDGSRQKKEELLLGVMGSNPGLVVVGGGAADQRQDVPNPHALVHVDGEVVTDAVAVALFRTDAPWAALRNHWFKPTGRRLTVTKVDETQFRAIEIDGQPAAKRYADALGMSVEDLDWYSEKRGFSSAPLGMKVGTEHFVRAPLKVMEDGSILFATMFEAGSSFELMQQGDSVEETARFFREVVPSRVSNPQAILCFDCGARRVVGMMDGNLERIGETFSLAPACAGFTVQYEIYCGFHINSTLTALAFGEN